MKAEPKNRKGYLPYIVIPQLSVEQQQPLKEWLVGQTCEVIEEEGENKYACCFYSDYSHWYEHWIKGKTAIPRD